MQDYGPGIPDRERAALFDPFFRGRKPSRPARSGLGLGLFICRQIVEQHGGRVDFESKRGAGGTSIVELPLHAGPGAGQGAQGEKPAGSARNAERPPTAARRRPRRSRPRPSGGRARRRR